MVKQLYIPYYGYNYEGGCIVGVYTDKETAERRLLEEKTRFADYSGVKEILPDEDMSWIV